MKLCEDFVRITPHHLSKSDRGSHLGPHISLKAFQDDRSICPVLAVENLVELRNKLGITHNTLFFSPVPPYAPIKVPQFQALIASCLTEAGITATPGSTRATAASAAFARGTSMDDVMSMGDWSSEATFFRFYASL